MSHNEILREIIDEQELAAHHGGYGVRQFWYDGTQLVQCSGVLDCGGCDPNGPFAPGDSTVGGDGKLNC